MKLSCPNCDQMVLPTDTVCWHCGYQLPRQPGKSVPQSENQVSTTTLEASSLSAVFVYGTVTALIIITFVLSIRSLSQHPLILLNPDTTINSGWTAVTDHRLRFTFDIPAAWQAFAKQNPQQQADFETAIANDAQYIMAVSPFNRVISDIESLFIVIGEKPAQITAVSGFVLIARSETLGRLSLDEAVALAQGADAAVEILQTNIVRSFVGDERASLSLKIPETRDTLICEQHIVQGIGESYLLAGCAPETRYQTYREPLEKILASFQLLR